MGVSVYIPPDEVDRRRYGGGHERLHGGLANACCCANCTENGRFSMALFYTEEISDSGEHTEDSDQALCPGRTGECCICRTD